MIDEGQQFMLVEMNKEGEQAVLTDPLADDNGLAVFLFGFPYELQQRLLYPLPPAYRPTPNHQKMI
jgi:hypothetical protein